MKAIILVGGEGTRLRPLTCNWVKAMVPILNRPFLEHLLLWLKGYGIDEVVLALCYRPECIADHFGDGAGLGIRLYYVQEEAPLGTAGAVKNAERYLKGERFFVLNGDIFTDLDLGAMLSFHEEREGHGTIALIPVDNPTIYGIVETDAEHRIKRFVEKPRWEEVTTNLINAGVYILEPEVLSYMPPQQFYMFEHHLFPKLLEMGLPLYGYPFGAYWIDMGTPEKYLQLHRDLLLGNTRRGPILGQGPLLGEGSHLDPSAQIRGPVLMGRGCTIEPQARLIGPTALGDGCHIGAGAMVEGSVLWQGVRVGAGATLRHCIIAEGSQVGSGCTIGQGAVLSDHVTVSAGLELEPGCHIWPGTRLGDEEFPLQNVDR
ncbi:MAG TPA: NDP-sugar synthase [Dehalococcoidia bacterium]|nr:NDP-sugar synthase [Dehalococcoidia bacterium]